MRQCVLLLMVLLLSVGRSRGQDDEVKRILDKAIQARGANSNKLVIQEVVFGDYKDFGGVKFWSKIKALRDGQLNVEGEVTEIKFPEKFDEKVFGQP